MPANATRAGTATSENFQMILDPQIQALIAQLNERAKFFDNRTDWDCGYATGLRYAVAELEALALKGSPEQQKDESRVDER